MRRGEVSEVGVCGRKYNQGGGEGLCAWDKGDGAKYTPRPNWVLRDEMGQGTDDHKR